MSFIDVRLPVKISLGSSGGARFQTDVVVYGNGQEYRNSRWSYHRASFDLSYVVKDRDQAIEVYNFFLTMGGKFHSFRVKDYLDHTSASDGVSSPTNTDQIIGTWNNNSNEEYPIIKNYSNGLTSYDRQITKVIPGTVKAAINGVDATASSTVDYEKGTIKFQNNFLPIGSLVTIGYEFDVHARFDQDDIDGIQYVLLRKDSSRDHFSMPPLSIIEVL